MWGSGAHGIRIPQQMLGVKQDGIVGPKTLEALNSQDAALFFARIHDRRREFFKGCPTFKYHGKGWLRRLDGIQYKKLVDNKGVIHLFDD